MPMFPQFTVLIRAIIFQSRSLRTMQKSVRRDKQTKTTGTEVQTRPPVLFSGPATQMCVALSCTVAVVAEQWHFSGGVTHWSQDQRKKVALAGSLGETRPTASSSSSCRFPVPRMAITSRGRSGDWRRADRHSGDVKPLLSLRPAGSPCAEGG